MELTERLTMIWFQFIVRILAVFLGVVLVFDSDVNIIVRIFAAIVAMFFFGILLSSLFELLSRFFTKEVVADNIITVLKNHAYISWRKGDHEQALATFKSALELAEPDSVDHHLIAAEISSLTGEFKIALEHLERAHQIDQKSVEVNSSLAIFYFAEDERAEEFFSPEKALMYAKAAYDLRNDVLTRRNLGQAYFYNEQWENAVEILSQTDIEDQPDLFLTLGISYAAIGNIPLARVNLVKAHFSGVELPPEFMVYLEETES